VLPVQRLGLLVFGVAFVVLFLIFAIAEGIGQPSVPAGYVALVKGVPSETGKVSQKDFERALEQSSAQAGLKTPPKPGSKKYEEAKKSALSSLFDAIWVQGQAEEMGIEVTDKEISEKLSEIKSQNFKTPAEFNAFLRKSHLSPQDVNERVRLQIETEKIQEQIGKSAAKPSQSQIQQYYDAAKGSQFTTPPSRDVRVVITKDKKKAEEATARLGPNPTPKDWKAVAKKYSTDPSTKGSGGLQKGITEGSAEEPLNAALFGAPVGKVEGPVHTKSGYFVFEVVKLNPEKVQSLDEAKSQISSQLEQQNQQAAFEQFVNNYSSTWSSRTFCASGYVIERCANYKAGHLASAPPACFEANPKGGRPPACPAPVQQLTPQLPGSATPIEPKGKRLPQRPNPGTPPAGEEGAAELPTPTPAPSP
jgi:parvulin-like peptidyl-prolyl isomerase